MERVRRERPEIIGRAAFLAIAGLVTTSVGPSWQLLGWGLVVLAIVTALTKLFVLPQRIVAWDTGAAGERLTAAYLAPLEDEGYVVLHDRRIPRRRANIDHIVIGPTGVFAIETKSYQGELRIRGGALRIAGRRRTAFVDQVLREAEVVSDALDGISVQGVLCVHRAGFPLFGRPQLEGVPIVSPRGLLEILRGWEVVLDPEDVTDLAKLARQRLRPATRAGRFQTSTAETG